MTTEIHDIIGVGFGPGNIAVAVALEEMGWRGSAIFLEKASGPSWHQGMLLDNADTQHNPLRDFATPRNPRSRFGFLNYLHEHDRFFDYLNLGLHYPLRKDYARYVQWVARHFDAMVSYAEEAVAIDTALTDEGPHVFVKTNRNRTIRARTLILAPGRTPNIPPAFQRLRGDGVVHLNDYLPSINAFADARAEGCVAVVGASQSAVEIVLDIANRFPALDVVNVQRGFGYKLKDTSQFSEKAYFPGFVDHFYHASAEIQRDLRTELWRSNYGSADSDVINQLYLRLYEQKLDGCEQIRLLTEREIVSAERQGENIRMALRHKVSGDPSEIVAGLVVLATGFLNFGAGDREERLPPLLSHLRNFARNPNDGTPVVTRDYRLLGDDTLPPTFLNGLNESTHGFGDAGSFSLLSIRAWNIAQSTVAALSGNESKRLIHLRSSIAYD